MAATDTPKTVIIDLDTREEAGVLGTEQLIQRAAIDKFKILLEVAYKGAKQYKKNASHSEKPFDRMLHRSYNTITLHGSRGSGKTTLLNSLIATIRQKHTDSSKNLFTDSDFEGDTPVGNIYVLDVIDPGLVETKEHVLVTIISMMREAVIRCFDRHTFDKNRRASWDEALNSLSEGLTRLDKIGPQNPHESWEDATYVMQKGLQSAQGSIVFETALATFVRRSLEILDKGLFLIAFDDIDTAINRGFDVLEIIRKYLAIPLVLVVIAGDLDLYSKIVRLEHWKKFGPKEIPSTESEVYLNKLDDLEDQYMMKLLKPSHRIELLRLDVLFNSPSKYSKYEAIVQYIGKDNLLLRKSLRVFIDQAIGTIYGITRSDQVNMYRSLILRQPTRTVIQFLKAFAEAESGAGTNLAVSRSIADIALGPLLRNQLSVDQINSADSQHLLLLIRDYINRKGLWASGYRLHPDIRDEEGDDTNLVTLALSAPLTNAIRQNPSLIFDYFVKLCLPHSALEYVPQNEGKIVEYLEFVSGKSFEDSLTEARQNVAVIVWKQAEENKQWTVNRGVIRVVSRSQQAEIKRAFSTRNITTETSVKNFWARTNGSVVSDQKLPARVRIDFNTIETLAGDKRPEDKGIYDSQTMRHVALLPFVEVVDRQSHTSTYCSVLNLIGLMGEFTQEFPAYPRASGFGKLAQLLSFPVPNWKGETVTNKPGSEDSEEEEDGAGLTSWDSMDAEDPSSGLLVALEKWNTHFNEVIRDNSSISIHFLARIWSRFYFTLVAIGNSVNKRDQFLGWLLHRQVVAFLSAVLIEEMNDASIRSNDSSITPFYENATTEDRFFIRNLKRVFGPGHEVFLKNLLFTVMLDDNALSEPRAISLEKLKETISEWEGRCPIFFALFSCPLWACYLYPETLLQEQVNIKTVPTVPTLLEVQALHWAGWLPGSEEDKSVSAILSRAKAVLQVDYVATKNGCLYENLYYPLSSIPVAAGNTNSKL